MTEVGGSFSSILPKATAWLAGHWQALEPFAATLATFFGAALISFGWQYWRQRGRFTFFAFLAYCFPVDGWKSKSSRIDIVMYFAGKLIRGVLAVGDMIVLLALSGGVAWLLRDLFPHHVAWHAGFPAIVTCAVLLFLAGDFANFYTHYLQHRIECLWELHKVHHSATFLSPLTTARMHPLGDKIDHLGAAIMVSLPAGVAVFLYGFDIPALMLLLATANMIGTTLVLDALRHSQFPVSFGALDRVVMSPHMHQFHHSAKYEHWDHNMGNKLSLWDWMFGTAVIPAKDEPLTFGIGRGATYDAQYDTLWGVYGAPLIGMVKVLLGRQPKALPTPQSLLEQGLTEPPPPEKARRVQQTEEAGA
ncbi:MAG TPA: sterol desaturase family protein [Asticcacaulis sp.]|nr:sterol desaturase family protein [Asticcacaulis sp.]